jgi:CRISPR-associated protein Cst2
MKNKLGDDMMVNETEIYEIAILGRATWQLHSLNNEGTVGNVTEPRSVTIIDPNTKNPITTDGISGEMLKHIHTGLMWTLTDKNNLCDACKVLNPEKFNVTSGRGSTVEEVLENALNKCDICDLHGFLITRPTVSRKSTIEFGWALGIPEIYRDIHTHARHALGGKTTENEESKGVNTPNSSEDKEEAVGTSTQMVYHRPTRSGVYAVISMFQPWRIGLNETRQDQYTYDTGNNEKRIERYKNALKAYQILFTRPKGAMSTTRLPHVEDFEGVIVFSTDQIPLPLISPLKQDYVKEITDISKKIDNSINVEEFKTLSEFVDKIGDLIDKKPYKLKLGE